LFSNKSPSLTRDSLSALLNAIYEFLRSLGLDLAPYEYFEPFLVNGSHIPVVDSVRFLGVTLDRKLNGVAHLRSLLDKGHKVSNIVTFLSG